jgi:hypothetical protein
MEVQERWESVTYIMGDMYTYTSRSISYLDRHRLCSMTMHLIVMWYRGVVPCHDR